MAASSATGATATVAAAAERRARLHEPEPALGPRAAPPGRTDVDDRAVAAGRPEDVVAVMPAPPSSRSGTAARTAATAAGPARRRRAARVRARRAGTDAPPPHSPTPRSRASLPPGPARPRGRFPR